MNRFIITLITLLGLAAVAPAAGLKNASFEDAGDSADIAQDWNRWGQWINRETEWSPTHSGACLLGYHHWQIEDTNNSGVWQDASDAKAGRRYKFSVFVCVDKGDPGTAPVKEIELRLECARGDTQLVIQSTKYAASDIPADGQWHQVSVTGLTTQNNLRLLLVVTPADKAPRGGSVKFDDASLEEVSDNSPAKSK